MMIKPNDHFDILIIGGSSYGWAAALDLAERGISVAMVTHLTYLIEDVTSPLDLIIDLETTLQHDSASLLYARPKSGELTPTLIKHRAEKCLMNANIPFLYSTHVIDISPSENGSSTIRLQHRGGSQPVHASLIIDATPRAWIAKTYGVSFSEPSNQPTVSWNTLGGDAESEESKGAIKNLGTIRYHEGEKECHSDIYRWTAPLALPRDDWESWSQLENQARLLSYRSRQLHDASAASLDNDRQFQSPHRATSIESMGMGSISDQSGPIIICGPCANLEGALKQEFLVHGARISFGKKVGTIVSEFLREPKGHQLKPCGIPIPRGSVTIAPNHFRAHQHNDSWIAQTVHAITEVDVLVLGGGTGGAPAGIAAARQGASTLVVEMCPALGGVGTQGRIGGYWFGNRVGFTHEIDKATMEYDSPEKLPSRWDTELKQYWLLQQLHKAGGVCWFGSMMIAAIVEGKTAIGALIATPGGTRAVYAKAMVDASGSSDLAAAAGAETVSIGAHHLALQGTGLSPIYPSTACTNTDYDFIDDNDVMDTTSAYVCARQKYVEQFDVSALVNSRERRRIVGDIEISPMDIRLGRIFPDTIVKSKSNFDTHGYTVHPYFLIQPPNHAPLYGMVPLRAMLPKGIHGVIVTGLGISAHRDAMPVIRMQADVQNQGFAAGLMATMVKNSDFRALDMDTTHEKLIELKILEPEFFQARDSFPLPKSEIEEAVKNMDSKYQGLDKIFTLPLDERCQLLKNELKNPVSEEKRLQLALILGMLGDATAAPILAQHISTAQWDEGWNYRGMHQFGRSISPVDGFIIALGKCGSSSDVESIIKMAECLPAPYAFSHIRALCETFETLNDPTAVPCLIQLLQKEGVQGHHYVDTHDRLAQVSDDPNDNLPRNRSLIELHLARALYRLDSSNAQAKEILNFYASDCRGIFARHANAVLAE